MTQTTERSTKADRQRMTTADLVAGRRSLITIDETAEVLNLKRTATYDAVRRGQLPSLRLGRRLFVPVPALLRLLQGEQDAPPTSDDVVAHPTPERPCGLCSLVDPGNRRDHVA